jgi:GT2 family glycosyltransferase
MGVTAAICTRDRPAAAAQAVGSLLAADPPPDELIVVACGESRAIDAALAAASSRTRARLVRADGGLSAARNAAMAAARSEVVAFTDDDCEATAGFIAAVESAFAGDARIGLLFGNVLPPQRQPPGRLIPSRVTRRPQLTRTIWGATADWMGACMAVRRETWASIGGFDEQLGAGTRFGAGEELDFAIRALLAGFYLLDTDRVDVIHHAAHESAARRELIGRYYAGTGAALAKHLRSQPGVFLALAIRLGLRWGLGRSAVALGGDGDQGLDHAHLQRLVGFLHGLSSGARLPVDPATVLFI